MTHNNQRRTDKQTNNVKITFLETCCQTANPYTVIEKTVNTFTKFLPLNQNKLGFF